MWWKRFVRWYKVCLLDRCPETLRRHRFQEVKRTGPYYHSCEAMSYCHHFPVVCKDCGQERVGGYAVEEVR